LQEFGFVLRLFSCGVEERHICLAGETRSGLIERALGESADFSGLRLIGGNGESLEFGRGAERLEFPVVEAVGVRHGESEKAVTLGLEVLGTSSENVPDEEIQIASRSSSVCE